MNFNSLPLWVMIPASLLILAAVLAVLAAVGFGGAVVAFLLRLDCLFNAILGGSSTETLSSRAHRMREKGQPVWGWTADAIDALFFWQPGHCEAQWRREVLAGWHE